MAIYPLFKFIVVFVGSAGVQKVVQNAVKMTLPINPTKSEKVLTKVGSYIISGYASDKAATYINDTLEGIFEKKKELTFVEFLTLIREKIGPYCDDAYWFAQYNVLADKSADGVKDMIPVLGMAAINLDYNNKKSQ